MLLGLPSHNCFCNIDFPTTGVCIRQQEHVEIWPPILNDALFGTATHCNTLQHTATHSSGFRLKQPKHVYKVCTAQIEQNRYSCLAQTLCAALRGVNTATPTTRHGSEQGGLKSPNRDYSDVTVSAVLHALHWCNLKAAEYFLSTVRDILTALLWHLASKGVERELETY